METTFFYTFSTIAQTLAGAIALLAAFVLYKLQTLNLSIESNAAYLAREWQGMDPSKREEAKDYLRLDQYNEFKKIVEDQIKLISKGVNEKNNLIENMSDKEAKDNMNIKMAQDSMLMSRQKEQEDLDFGIKRNKMLTDNLDGKRSLLVRFYIALSLTVILIISSIFFLTKTSYFAMSCWCDILLNIAWMGFILCILSYVWLIIKAIGKSSYSNT